MIDIKLANGSTYPADVCGVNGDALHINVTEGNLLDLVLVFGDPERTARIERHPDLSDAKEAIYEGYTALVSARMTDTGVTLILNRG